MKTQQSMTFNNDDPAQWRIYASLDRNLLKIARQSRALSMLVHYEQLTWRLNTQWQGHAQTGLSHHLQPTSGSSLPDLWSHRLRLESRRGDHTGSTFYPVARRPVRPLTTRYREVSKPRGCELPRHLPNFRAIGQRITNISRLSGFASSGVKRSYGLAKRHKKRQIYWLRQECCARSRYQGQGQVTKSHSDAPEAGIKGRDQ